MSGAPVPEWEQIAGLRPRLLDGARSHRHIYRGVPWHVVQDGASSRHARLDDGAWRVAGLMDGERTLGQIHEALTAKLGDAAPTRDEVARVLHALHASELLECEALAEIFGARRRRHRRQRWQRLLASPLSQRVPLLDPQSWLDGWLPVIGPLVTPAGFLVWLVMVLGGAAAAVASWDTIGARLTGDVLSAHNLALMAIAYVLVKTLHELGHAFATRVFGGEVHEMGVMFLVFVPVPYVDASASSAFPQKWRRVAVAAAGIMVELFMAALALAVWLSVEPGLVSDLAFDVMLVGGVSSLLFNGNPLLRFDGYFVLSDVLEIPNLASRSARYLGYLAQRYLCGARDVESPLSAPGERPWLLLYGLVAPVYRLVVIAGIVLFVASAYPVVGVVLAVWAATSQLVLPAARGLVRLLSAPVLAGRRVRAALVLGGPAAAALAAGCVVPLPVWTHAEGVVWLPEHAQVRAGADGFLARQLVPAGTAVDAGTALFALDAAADRAEVEVLEHRLEEHRVRHDAALFHDRGQLQALGERMARVEAELASARERAADLVVRSPVAGTLLVPDARRLEGRYVHQGGVLAYVTDSRPQTARVVVRQDEIERVSADTRSVRLKLPGHLAGTFEGEIVSAAPSAARELPAVALGALGGGRIPVDTADPGGRTPAQSVFLIDVALPTGAPRVAPGTRVFVRLEHAGAPLAAQLARAARQLLLERFGA